MATTEPSPRPAQGEDAEAIAIASKVKRQVLMGAALLLALASIFAGVIAVGRAIEYGLAALATVCVLLALRFGGQGKGSKRAG
jgi:hypothetical protein